MRTSLLRISVASAFGSVLGLAAPATAEPVTLGPAVSYEYIGLKVASETRTSNVLGTLDTSSSWTCGGICRATTYLGSIPGAELSLSEANVSATSGGFGLSTLRYAFVYDDAPGTYNVTLHGFDQLAIEQGAEGETFLGVGFSDHGMASGQYELLSVRNCVGTCYGGFPPSTSVSAIRDFVLPVIAGTPYVVTLAVYVDPGFGQSSAKVDSYLTAESSTGSFRFSPGVIPNVGEVPEPATWSLMLAGIAMLGGMLRRRQLAPA